VCLFGILAGGTDFLQAESFCLHAENRNLPAEIPSVRRQEKS
jgi:hypothetical protein